MYQYSLVFGGRCSTAFHYSLIHYWKFKMFVLSFFLCLLRKSKWSKTMHGTVTFSYRKGQIAESSLLIPLRPLLMYYTYTNSKYMGNWITYMNRNKKENELLTNFEPLFQHVWSQCLINFKASLFSHLLLRYHLKMKMKKCICFSSENKALNTISCQIT